MYHSSLVMLYRTVGYHDDVLGAKMKSLVYVCPQFVVSLSKLTCNLSAGALKRSKIEKIEPTISYEAFVEELDGGDSFTTSLIDVLVKVSLNLLSLPPTPEVSALRNWPSDGFVRLSQTAA